MSNLAKEQIIALDKRGLSDLDISLSDALTRLKLGDDRSGVEPRDFAREPAADRPELGRDVKRDILEFYRRGVRIARFAETTPLKQLCAAANSPLPASLRARQDSLNVDHYLSQVTFSALLSSGEYLQSAQFELDLSDDVANRSRQIRTLAHFPMQEDRGFFSIDLEGAVGIDANAQFSVSTAGAAPLPFVEAKADAAVKASIVIGPFHFGFRRAAIEVIGVDDSRVVWRYELASELSGANEFKSMLLLEIAAEAKSATMAAKLRVAPRKRQWLLFAERLPVLEASEILDVALVPRPRGAT